jgi:hypothetical protein
MTKDQFKATIFSYPLTKEDKKIINEFVEILLEHLNIKNEQYSRQHSQTIHRHGNRTKKNKTTSS